MNGTKPQITFIRVMQRQSIIIVALEDLYRAGFMLGVPVVGDCMGCHSSE